MIDLLTLIYDLEGRPISEVKHLVSKEATIPLITVNGVLYRFPKPISVETDDEITVEVVDDETVAITISHRYEAALTEGDKNDE